MRLHAPSRRSCPSPRITAFVTVLLAVLTSGSVLFAQELQVLSAKPRPRTVSAPVETTVQVRFDRPVDPASVTAASFRVFGRWSGPASGALVVSPDGTRVSLTPSSPFFAGETVLVELSELLVADDGSELQPGGYAFQFWTAPSKPGLEMTELDVMTTRATPREETRAYGGVASDVDHDGYPDLTIVNEVTDDLRVFLNRGDGSALFHPYLEPPEAAGATPSPIEPGDFDGDGTTDVAVANTQGDSLSVLLGNGDGTFQPQRVIPVGENPRAVAVFDVDGDGDHDIVNTNYDSDHLTLALNDGSGVFGPATPFEGGVAGERSLAAADMDEDGRLDLVVGGFDSETVAIALSNGDGTFTPAAVQQSGGSPWMLATGDVDGDGHDDVVTVNSNTDSGSVLLGSGLGSLSLPADSPLDPLPIATDLADLDGDGDLDWVTSSFFGDWLILLNDGTGAFALHEIWPASEAASCALAYDGDNDGDLDLALIDELADEVILLRNGGASGVACEDVANFLARCTPGLTVQARLLLVDDSHDGETVVISLDGQPFDVTVSGNAASLAKPTLGGQHTVALDDPAGCVAPLPVTCP